MPFSNEPFDTWDQSIRPNPHPLYSAMREEALVYRGIGPVTGDRFWFLTCQSDRNRMIELLSHPDQQKQLAASRN